MAKKQKVEKEPAHEDGGSASATAKPKQRPRKAPLRKPPQQLPPWKVLLHNDDVNEITFVVNSVVQLTPLNTDEARQRVLEANETGAALLLMTHKERAELYKDQFESKGLTVTIEPG